MDLKDFIKEAIKDVTIAISESNAELKGLGAIVNPHGVVVTGSKDNPEIYGYLRKESEGSNYRRPVHLINFDVAVTTGSKKDGNEGIGVNVVGIKLSKDGSKIEESNTSSRLQFGIPIALPVGNK